MHQLLEWLALPQFGLGTVFIVSFVSATLLPVGSEAAVFGLIKLNPDLFWPAIGVATLGNTLGGGVSWWMGLGAHRAWDAARRHRRLNHPTGADIFFLLDKAGVTTAVSYCEFQGEGTKTGDATVVKAGCHEEGSEEVTPYELTLTPDSGGYTIGFPDGTRWGPLARCGK